MIKFGCNEIDKKLQSHYKIINLIMKKRKKKDTLLKKIGRLCLVSLR